MLKKVKDMGNITNFIKKKLFYRYRLAYLHLTVTHFRGQVQGQAYFDSKNLGMVTDVENIAKAIIYNVVVEP